jgi:LemA protein
MIKIIIYVCLGIILIYFIITLNSLIQLRNKVKEAFATMDVYLKRRWDLIPSLVEIVKGYATHEKDTFENVADLRSNSYDNMNQKDKINSNLKMNDLIKKLMLLKENYPELKANQNFMDLSKNLTETEDLIANSRKYYNAVVRMYNNKVEMFPSNLVAKLLGYKDEKMFEATEEEKQNVNVSL